jgi:[ribosomal protein S18]-alanine N-acetyltransferase
MIESLTIDKAADDEREWAASLMARSEPWITLGASLDDCRESCRDPEYLLYIARCEGRPRGAILLQRRGVASSPYVKSIAVDPRDRSRGIGAALLEFAENLFRGEARHIFLCVSSFNRRAYSFYERQGYSAVGVLEEYIVEGASEILMHKRLR